MDLDQQYMWRCLGLAKRGAGMVAPNPMVGAVLVHENRIIGEGWHKKFGEAHAEPNCISDAEKKGFAKWIPLSTMYVSLEPCAHFGKTPPCAELLIRHGIRKVVIATRDPFEAVDGRGIEKLENAGIEVVCGILETEAKEINKRFFTFHEKKRPYIILKWAQTKDGFIGSETGRVFISNEFSHKLVHRWRSEEAAILVGSRTAAIDDPQLTNRYWAGPSPVRIVADPQLKLKKELRIFNGESPLIVLNQKKHSFETNRVQSLAEVNYFRADTDNVKEICDVLFHLNIQSLIVEGGARLLRSFIEVGLWDEARVFTSSYEAEKLPGPVPAPPFDRGVKTGEQEIDTDLLEFFENPA